MSERPAADLHVLIVGNGREIPGLVRHAQPGIRVTMMTRLAVVRRIRNPHENVRILALPHDGGADEWVALARFVHARDPFHRLATFTEKDQDKAAAIGSALDLATHHPETIRWVHDKHAMRRRLQETGLDPTLNAVVEEVDEVARLAEAWGYPVVVKPIAGSGSSGVTIVENEAEIGAAVAWARSADDLDDPRLLVEQFIDGVELSVEGFSEAGRHRIVCLTQKVKSEQHCVERGQVIPGEFPAEIREAVDDLVPRALDALGIRNGLTHTEVMWTGTELRVIETHLRPAGDEIPEMLRDTFGIDLIAHLVQQSLGHSVLEELDRQLAKAEDIHTYAAVWYTFPTTAGTIAELQGVDAAADAEGVVAVTALLEVGDTVSDTATNSMARVIEAKATGSSPDEALSRARSAAESVVVVTRPTPSEDESG